MGCVGGVRYAGCGRAVGNRVWVCVLEKKEKLEESDEKEKQKHKKNKRAGESH
jgi:hypothetical protein